MVEPRNVDVNETLELQTQGALLLDVREDDEWAAGRSALATHISLGEVPDHVEDLPRDRVIVCICRSGARSGRASKFLLEQGFEAVNMEGGMLNWAAQDQPLVADAGTPVIN
jgi:rhodanese-related sulfurtransferase